MFKSFQHQWTELDQQPLPWGPVSPLPIGGVRPPFTVSRALDIVIATLAIAFLLPLMITIALAIKLTEGGPVLFRHRRVGYGRRQFECFKFRTMHVNSAKILADHLAANPAARQEWQLSQKLQNDPRVSALGLILRTTSMDELPQLFNVLRGDMSFVGPRPERPFFVEQLRQEVPYYDLRHIAKPGLTGWAQVKYPYGASKEDALAKLQYDLYYVKNRSLLLDLIVIVATIQTILFARGAR